MKKILYTLILILLCCGTSNADCTGESPTWTTTPDRTSVAACVAGSTAGDTINVTAGDGSETWTSAVTVDKAVNIIGPGKDNLTISWTSETAFTISLAAARISGFGFYTTTGQAAIDVRGQGWRIDHCKYNYYDAAGTHKSGVAFYPNGTNTTTQPYGLIDNNEFINGKIDVFGGGNHANESAAWFDDLSLGSANAVYIEDNTFVKTNTTATQAVDANRGGKYVFRYNTITGTIGESGTGVIGTMAHSLQADNTRGTRKWELYGNTITSTHTNSYAALFMRGGTGVMFYNDTTSSVNWNVNIYFDNVRSFTFSTDVNDIAEGRCDGDNNYDMNDDAYGWPCRDQIGRSSDASLWSTITFPAPDQASVPAYVWGNYGNSGLLAPTIQTGSTNHIKANRDYYTQVGTFTGASGVGCGTRAQRPGTCTAGVGYWETDQSCSDLSDHTGASPTTPISGTLYKCTTVGETTEWQAYYTPYTYPHPLREATEEDAVAPTATWAIDASGLIATGTFSETVNATTKTGVSFTGSVTGAITATYKDGMPGSIVRYDLNKEVQQSDTVVVDYTTPGDGIKDLAGNALADISDGAVSNGSTQGTPPLVTLTIGTHTGATVNVYPGINCGSTCGPVEYDSGSVLTLNVTTLRNYTGCTIGGTGCGASTTMSEARTCTVTCTKISPDVAIGSGAAVTLGSGAVGTLY
jgi:hypothetical protein